MNGHGTDVESEIVYLGVGSNIDPARNIPAAFDELDRRGVRVAASSRFYRTAPIGRPDQKEYANGVWRTAFSGTPRELKELLRQTERYLGRRRTADKFAPRPIDLDILLFGRHVVDESGLTIPDPHILERSFLVRCLLELEPGLSLPGVESPLSELASPGVEELREHDEIMRIIHRKLEMQR